MKLRTLKAFVLIIFGILLRPNVEAQVHLNDSKAARDFVQKFYDWYGPVYAGKRHIDAHLEVLKHKPQCLDKKLLNGILADDSASLKTKEIVGLGFDPFTNSLEKRKGYQTDKAIQRAGRFFVGIHDIGRGFSPKAVQAAKFVATAEVAKIDGHWVFVNFSYPKDYGYGRGENLLGMLDSLSKDRTK